MEKLKWHRLFGLTLTDLLLDSAYQVELEKDVSLKKQFLDIVVVRKTVGMQTVELPVGLENLTSHNLLTYKSLQESLDSWAIEELIGYYSNYRKIVNLPSHQLLPVQQFQLYAVSTRYPSKLLSGKVEFQKIQPGVFDLTWGDRIIRLIVLNQIKRSERNAFWLLFSGKADEFVYANQHYQWHCPTERAVLNQLYEWYKHRGAVMPYTMDDFTRDFTREHLHLLPPLERLEGLPAEERLKGLSSDAVFSQFSAEERLKGLSSDTVFSQFSIDEIASYLEKLKKQNADN